MLASLGAPSPKWTRVNPSKIDYREPNGTWSVLTDGDYSFQFKGLSWRQAKITFDAPIKKFVLKFKVSGIGEYPYSADASGLITYTGWHKLASGVLEKALPVVKSGSVTVGSAAPGHETWLDILDVYGEVLK